MVVIETATPKDLPQILQIQRLAFAREAALNNDPDIPPMTQTLEEMIGEHQERLFLKAEQGEIIVGSVRGHAAGGRAYVGRLIVHPGHQRQGIGRRLMAAIEERLGSSQFEIFAGQMSLTNIAFYQRLGYTPTRTEHHPGHSLVYMVKERTQP